jgi:flotillin
LVTACNGSSKDAATLLMVEKIKELVALQAEAISNLKIDKITVWDSGSGDKGSSTANFMSSMIKSLPALHDIAAMAGVELPGYLGRVSAESEEQSQVS